MISFRAGMMAKTSAPRPTPFIAAGYLFGRGQMLAEVPFDPDLPQVAPRPPARAAHAFPTRPAGPLSGDLRARAAVHGRGDCACGARRRAACPRAAVPGPVVVTSGPAVTRNLCHPPIAPMHVGGRCRTHYDRSLEALLRCLWLDGLLMCGRVPAFTPGAARAGAPVDVRLGHVLPEREPDIPPVRHQGARRVAAQVLGRGRRLLRVAGAPARPPRARATARPCCAAAAVLRA